MPSDAQSLTSLRTRIVPYFTIMHATRGKLPGPFAKLPPGSALRYLVLDVVFTLGQRAGGQAEGLEDVVGEAVRETTERAYWIAVRQR